MKKTNAPPDDTDRSHRPGEEELRRRLTPLQFEVTRRGATEPAFTTPTGTTTRGDLRRRGLRRAAVQLARQVRLRHRLAELHQAAGPGEHRRDEGPQLLHGRAPRCAAGTPTPTWATSSPTARRPPGMRYCINSAALRFVPVAELEQQGYGRVPQALRLGDAMSCSRSPSPTLLAAVRQFNEGRYFACHETLEELWIAEPGELRRLYQGMLQVGVGLHHLQQGNERGALSLLDKGTQLLRLFCSDLPDDRRGGAHRRGATGQRRHRGLRRCPYPRPGPRAFSPYPADRRERGLETTAACCLNAAAGCCPWTRFCAGRCPIPPRRSPRDGRR